MGILLVPGVVQDAESQQQGNINLYWTNISITSSSADGEFRPGDTAQIEATLEWWSPDGLQPMYLFDNYMVFEYYL